MNSEQKPFDVESDSSESAREPIDRRRFLGYAGAGALATLGGRMFARGQNDPTSAAAQAAADAAAADSRLPGRDECTPRGNSR